DAVVDVDPVEIDGDREAADRVGGNAEAEVDRGLRLEVARAEGAGDRAADGQRADVDRQAVDEIGRRRGEILLVKRRRAETVRDRPAERKALGRLEAQSELAVDGAAEVREMFKAAGQNGSEALEQIGVELGISGVAVPALVGRAGRRDAREALRAGGR